MTFIVRNNNSISFTLQDNYLDLTFAPSEGGVDLENIFNQEALYVSSVPPNALYAAIDNEDLVRRNDADDADIPKENAFDDAIWRWAPTREQKEALAGSYGTPSDTNRYLTHTDAELERVKENTLIVTSASGVGQFNTIYAAIQEAIAHSPSAVNPYTILIYPGVYVEQELTVPSYVYLVGTNREGVIVQPDGNHNVINVSDYTSVNFLTVQNAPTGYAAIYGTDCEFESVIHKVAIRDSDLGVYAKSGTLDNYVYLEYVDFTLRSTDNCSIKVESTTGLCYLEGENTFVTTVASNPQYGLLTTGSTAVCSLSAGGFFGKSGDNTAIKVENGAYFNGQSLVIEFWDKGICAVEDSGSPRLHLTAITFNDNTTYNLCIDNSNASGYLIGASEYLKTEINKANSFFIFNKNLNVITVGKKGGDFYSVFDAVAQTGDAAEDNPYLILVEPGTYTEPEITLPSWVYIQGSSIESVIIEPDATNHNVINLSQNTALNFLTVMNAGSGYCGIDCTNVGVYATLHKVSVQNCYIGYNIVTSGSGTVPSELYMEYCDIEGVGPYCINILGDGVSSILVNMENLFIYGDEDSSTNPTIGLNIEGNLVTAQIQGATFQGVNPLDGVAICAKEETSLEIGSIKIIDWNIGIHAPDTGSEQSLNISVSEFKDNTLNIKILNPFAKGFLFFDSPILKTEINHDCLFYVVNKYYNSVTVSLKGGDFTSVKDAVDYVALQSPSATNRWWIHIFPGIYSEDTITLVPYAAIRGASRATTIIKAATTGQHLFIPCPNSSISNVTITGTTDTDKYLFYWNNSSTVDSGALTLRNISIGETFGILYQAAANGYSSTTDMFDLFSFDSHVELGFNVSKVGTGASTVFLRSSYISASPSGSRIAEIHGTGAELYFSEALEKCTSGGGVAFNIWDGGKLSLEANAIDGFDVGVKTTNNGVAPTLLITGTAIENSTTYDLQILHADTAGSVNGTLQRTKVFCASDALTLLFNDFNNSITLTGDMYQGSTFDTTTNMTPMLQEHSPSGVISGGVLTSASNFVITANAGEGYVVTGAIHMQYVSWTEQTLYTLAANTNYYIYVNSSGTLSSSTSLPDVYQNIILGRVNTDSSICFLIKNTPRAIDRSVTNLDVYLRNAIGPIFVSGCITTEDSTPRKLDVTNGNYYYGVNHYLPTGAAPISFYPFWTGNKGTSTDIVATTSSGWQYDLAGTLTDIPGTDFAKHSLYVVNDGGLQKFLFVYAQITYATQLLAQGAGLPTTPLMFDANTCLIASIIVQQGQTNIIQIRDERPLIGFKASGISASASHSGLLDLDKDDHCFDEETELLTKTGFKKIDEISENDLALTLNLEKDKLEYNPIKAVYKYDNFKELVRFKNKYGEICVTPKHTMIYENTTKNSPTKKWFTCTAEEALSKSVFNIPVCADSDGDKFDKIPEFFTLLGLIISEGNFLDPKDCGYGIRIYQNKKRAGFINDILEKNNVPYTYHEQKDCANWYLRSSWCRENIRPWISEKRISEKLMGLRGKNFIYFLRGMIFGDGCARTNVKGGINKQDALDYLLEWKRGKYSYSYATADDTLKDQFVHLCTLNGIAANAFLRKCGFKGENGHVWSINLRKSSTVSFQKGIKDIIPYKGRVWCASVENKTLVLRRKNFVFIAGNTQYILTNGSRAMTGSLNVGGNSITNVNLVDGIDVSAHASRHLPGGSDALATDMPISIAASNSSGTAASFSRSDHAHQGVTSVKVTSGSPRYDGITLNAGLSMVITDSSGTFTFTPINLSNNELYVTYPVGSGLQVSFTGGNALFNGTAYTVSSGTLTLLPNINVGRIYVDNADGVVKASTSATIPDNCMVLAYYITDSNNVTTLTDKRVWINQNTIWGQAANISTIQPDDSAAAGSSERYARADHKHAISTTTPSTLTPDLVNTEGSSTSFTREDHLHNVPTAAPSGSLTATTVNTQGSTAFFARADHLHAITTGAPVTITPDLTNTTGSSANIARSDHLHNIPTAAPLTSLSATTTNASGTASSFIRSDHTHAILTGLPSTITPALTNSSGTSANLSRADHIHNLPTGLPVTIATTNASGSAASFSFSDHVHSHGAQIDGTLHAVVTTTSNGFMSAADKIKVNALLNKRAGIVAAGTFSGSPKKATVTFTTAMSSATYPITITGGNVRSWTYESRTTAGFVINANANTALTLDVSWSVEDVGEGY